MNKDPVFRIFVIIVLGIILFQMIFNLITGGENMGDMSSSNLVGNSTSSLDSLATGLIVLLIKFLVIALLISIIIGVLQWMKKNYFPNINLKQYINQNPMMKSIMGIVAAIAGLFLLIYVYNYLINPSMGNTNNFTSPFSTTDNNTGGFSGTLGITGVVTFLVKILVYVFVISLIISILAFLKKQLEAGGLHLFNTNSATGNVAGVHVTSPNMEPVTNKIILEPELDNKD